MQRPNMQWVHINLIRAFARCGPLSTNVADRLVLVLETRTTHPTLAASLSPLALALYSWGLLGKLESRVDGFCTYSSLAGCSTQLFSQSSLRQRTSGSRGVGAQLQRRRCGGRD